MTTPHLRPRHTAIIAIAMVLVIAVLLYFPGLNGPLVFDDLPNIVENSMFKNAPLTWEGAQQAAFSSKGNILRRPVSMLSFWANLHVSGLEPAGFKLTNLAIHLLNGVLVFWLSARLLAMWNARSGSTLSQTSVRWIAMGAMALWLLHPLQLTSVLYVVQRMNSLATLFTLAGLISYLSGRARIDQGERGWPLIVSAFVPWGVLALFSKESGALLVLYMAVIEATLLSFQSSSLEATARLRRAWGLGTIMLAAAIAIHLTRDWSSVMGAYATREFTLAERLMTEARVLWLYLQWALLPIPSNLGLFHDDITLSRGWFAPPSTLLAVAAWIGTIAVAWQLRHRLSWFTFAVAWYLTGHALESGFIPLEPVFEHRNYLPLLGPALAVSYGLLSLRSMQFHTVKRAAFAAMLLSFSVLTTVRAYDWGGDRLLAAEARHHPRSAWAQAQYGEQLTSASLAHPESAPRHYAAGRSALLTAADLDANALIPLFALILLDAVNRKPLDTGAFDELQQRLSSGPLSRPVMLPFARFERWLRAGHLHLTEREVSALYGAAIINPRIGSERKAALIYKLSVYYGLTVRDISQSLRYARAAVIEAPENVLYRLSLASLALRVGDLATAEKELRQAEQLDTQRLQESKLELLKGRLATKHQQNSRGDSRSLPGMLQPKAP